jgi:NAD(P)-dependent dehydrogenase (short-subunit alcohol dehydrogenase family)
VDLQLQDRVVLVVGGAGYLGAAVVRRAREEGATVVIASRHPGEDGVALDARDSASVQAAVAQVLAEHGRIDAAVVTAAPSLHTLDPALSNDPDQVADAVDGKSLAFLRVANEVLPVMREAGFGRVVGVAGQAAVLTGNLVGAVRNVALIVAAKNLADEYAGTGVGVNVVNPAVVSDHPAAEVTPGQGGQSSPEQIADLIAFLISPLNAVSGEAIAIGHRVQGLIAL